MHLTVSPHARVASLTLRRHVWRYAAIVLVAQLVVAWAALPLLSRLLDLLLATVDDGAVNLDSLGGVLTSPVTVLLLVVFLTVAAALVFAELALVTVCATRHLDGRPVTPRGVAADLLALTRRLLGPSGLLFVLYGLFLLPLANIGVTSAMTRDVAVPAFISGELTKTTTGAVLWWSVNVVLVYLALRLLLTLAVLADGEHTLGSAMRQSWRATGILPWRPGVALLAAAVAITVLLLVLGGAGVLLTALATVVGDSLAPAGFVLALVDLARFVLLGLAAAWVSLYLVAWRRDLDDAPPPAPTGSPAGPVASWRRP